MTLPTGLSAHSLAMDDSPQVRGAIAFCRAAAASREAAQARTDAVPDRAFVDHAALVVGAAYRAKDTRALIFRQHGVEIVR